MRRWFKITEGAMNLLELQEDAIAKGYVHRFSCSGNHVICDGRNERYHAKDLAIVSSNSVDLGTDPGDDATLYLIEASDGTKGTLIMPASVYADHDKADLIDHLRRHQS